MIIRTTLSKWVVCSDLSFLLKMCFDGQGLGLSQSLLSLFIHGIIRFINEWGRNSNEIIYFQYCHEYCRSYCIIWSRCGRDEQSWNEHTGLSLHRCRNFRYHSNQKRQERQITNYHLLNSQYNKAGASLQMFPLFCSATAGAARTGRPKESVASPR